MTTPSAPIPSHRHPRVTWSRLKLKWPLLVWLLAIAVIVLIYQDTIRTGTVSGVVEVVREEPAPIESARLISLGISDGQRVNPGDLIAQFDTSVIDAEIAEIKSTASSDQLEYAAHAAELEARFQLDQTQLERQFEAAISSGEIRKRDLTLQYQLDLAKLDVLSNQLRQINGLIGTSTAEARELVVYRGQLETLARTTALYPAAIAAIETDITTARAQLTAARKWTNTLGPVTNAIAAQQNYANSRELISALQKRKDLYTIRATNPGTVSRINFRPGAVVPAAAAIASIVIQSTPRIVAYIPEWMANKVAVGTVGIVAQPLLGNLVIGNATVVTIAPEVATLPGVASPVAGMPIRGRRAVLQFNNPVTLMPGETITIRFGDPAWVLRLRAIRDRFAGETAAPKSAPAKPEAAPAATGTP